MYPEEQSTEDAEQESAPRRPGRRRRLVPLATAAVVVVLLAGVTVLAWPVVFRPAAATTGGEVFLEPATAPGQDPFTDSVVFGNPPGTKSQTPIGAGDGIPTVRGDTPALYGGSTNEKVCDRAKLITFLESHADKAAAWAGVLGVATVDIAAYIGTLTPVQLRADTRVTNHGFRDGHATTLQSVLQAGTAVLVDDLGRPRVKCGCGNPLLEPVATPVSPVYTGERWDGFSERGVSVVAPAAAPVVRLVVYDVVTGGTFSRPVGTDGAADTPLDGPTSTPSAAPAPTPTLTRCPAGTHDQNGSCVRALPAGCPSGQTRVSGRCVPVPVPVTCPAGSHLDGTTCVPDHSTINCPDGSHLSDDGRTCDTDPKICPGGNVSADGATCLPLPTPEACEPGTLLQGGTCAKACPRFYRAGATGACVSEQPCPVGTAPDPNGTCHTTAGRRRRRSPGTVRRTVGT